MDKMELDEALLRIKHQFDEKKQEVYALFATLKVSLPKDIRNVTVGQLREAGGSVDPDIYLPKEAVDYLRKHSVKQSTNKYLSEEIEDARSKSRDRIQIKTEPTTTHDSEKPSKRFKKDDEKENESDTLEPLEFDSRESKSRARASSDPTWEHALATKPRLQSSPAVNALRIFDDDWLLRVRCAIITSREWTIAKKNPASYVECVERLLSENGLMTDEIFHYVGDILANCFGVLVVDPLFLQSNSQTRQFETQFDNAPIETKVLFPLNVGNNHWCLVCIDLKSQRKLLIYDSLKKPEVESYEPYLERIYEFVGSAIEGVRSFPKKLMETSQQKDFTSCGLFTLAYMFNVARDENTKFDADHILSLRLQIYERWRTGIPRALEPLKLGHQEFTSKASDFKDVLYATNLAFLKRPRLLNSPTISTPVLSRAISDSPAAAEAAETFDSIEASDSRPTSLMTEVPRRAASDTSAGPVASRCGPASADGEVGKKEQRLPRFLNKMVQDRGYTSLIDPSQLLKAKSEWPIDPKEGIKSSVERSGPLIKDWKLVEVLNYNTAVRPTILCALDNKSGMRSKMWLKLSEVVPLKPREPFIDFIRMMFIFHRKRYNTLVESTKKYHGEKSNEQQAIEESIPTDMVSFRKYYAHESIKESERKASKEYKQRMKAALKNK